MRRDNMIGSVKTIRLMDTLPKTTKQHSSKHITGTTSKPKQKDNGAVSRHRRYSVDIVSSKPIVSHNNKNGHEGASDRRFTQRRFSLCTTKLESDKSKENNISNKQSEVRSILKSGVSSVCSSSVHSSETESSISEEKQSSDVKCSYRLPKSTGTGKLRKCVSFREDEFNGESRTRRFSSPAMDLSANFLLSPSPV